MEFRESQAIYLQIADYICENVLTRRWKEGDRIASIRELSMGIEVNPNTVLRAYNYLQDLEIIHNQRGIGYFVSADAHEKTRELMRDRFVRTELPRIFKTMDLLEMSCRDLEALRAGTNQEEKKPS